MREWLLEAVLVLGVTVAAAVGVWQGAEAVGAEREAAVVLALLVCVELPLAWTLWRAARPGR